MGSIKERMSDPRLRFEKHFAECYGWVGSSTMTLEDGAPKFAKLLEVLAPVAPTEELQSKLETASKAIGAVPARNTGRRLPQFFRDVEREIARYVPSVRQEYYRPSSIFNTSDFFKIAEDLFALADLNRKNLLVTGGWCDKLTGQQKMIPAFKQAIEMALEAK